MFCVFVGCLPGITGSHSTRLFYGGPAALQWRGRGAVPSLAAPPAHDQRSLNSGNNLLFTLPTLSTTVYSVLQRLTLISLSSHFTSLDKY